MEKGNEGATGGSPVMQATGGTTVPASGPAVGGRTSMRTPDPSPGDPAPTPSRGGGSQAGQDPGRPSAGGASATQARPRPKIVRETNKDGTPLPHSAAGNALRRRAGLTDDKADMVSGEADRLDSEGRLPDVAADLRQNVEDLRREADRLRDEGYENDRNEAARAGFWDPEGLNRGPDGVDRPPPRPGR